MKKDSEILLAQFIRDYELYDELGEFYETENEEQQNQKTVFKYVRADEYDIYENAFVISGVNIKRKDNVYQLDTMAYQWDFYCKLQILYYAHKGEYLTPYTLHKKMKLISGGWYTAWKGFFMESVLSEFFDVERREYRITGMDELLNNSQTCALLLKKCICMEDCEEDNEADRAIWNIIGKVVGDDADYQLTKDEKNRITLRLLGKRLFEKSDTYLSSKRIKKNSKKGKTKLLVNKRTLGEKLNDMCKDYEVAAEESKPDEENEEGRQICFPQYLAAIMAAICEYHESNPFFIETNIWKKQISVKKLHGIEQDDEKWERLSKNYARLEVYCDYMKRLDQIKQKGNFLEQYEAFSYQLIYKILSPRNPNKDKKIQYYIVEQLIGMELFERETDIIYKNLSGEWDEKKLNQEHRALGDILGRIFSFSGVISKIELAKAVLAEYFANYQKPTELTREDVRTNRKMLLNKIKYEDLLFKFRERIYAEDILGDKSEMPIGKLREKLSPKSIICGGRVEKDDESSLIKIIEEYLCEYKSKADKIVDLKENGNEELTPTQLKDLAENEMTSDEKRKIIKKWVICNSVLQEILYKFEFVREEE